MTQTDIWSNRPISEIQEDDMKTFKSIVIADVKGEADQNQKDILLANIDLWNYNLQIIRRDIELQISCQKTKTKLQSSSLDTSNYEEAEAIKNYINDQDIWRMSALKFLSNVERRTLYVKMLIADLNKTK